MSEQSNDIPDRDELRDRLVDAGLREVIGGQTPPDLSAAILAKAGVAGNVEPLVVGDTAMASGELRSGRRISPWLALAVAASVAGVGAWLWLPNVQTGRETARVTAPVSGPQLSAPEQPSADRNSERLEESLTPQERAWAPQSIAAESLSARSGAARPVAPISSPQDGAVPATARVGEEFFSTRSAAPAPADDFDSTVDMIKSTVEAETWSDQRGEAFAENLTLQISQSQSVESQGQAGQSAASPAPLLATKANTPAAGAPTRLWHRSAGEGGRGGVGGGVAPSDLGLQGLINDAYSVPESHGLKGQAAGKEIRMLVTPRILIEEQEQDRLADHDQRVGIENRYAELHDLAEGRGPELGGDRYTRIVENAFKAVSAANTDNRLSTFSIDVDTASYANVRQFLMQSNTLPPPDAVRIEELVNYFDYDYTPPTGDVPFAANVEAAGCPWAPEHRLVRVGIKGREMDRSKRPQSNLVFLIDVSGSMDEPQKLPLLVEGMRMLTRELGENDRVAIVVYASSEGLALESTPGTDQSKILAALDRLAAGGSTAGGAGIQLAYKVAADHFIKGGVNRVILCTDGDFNVGVTSPAELERMAESKAKETGVFLTVLGFGRGNLNDAMMEQIADKGNGNYHYVDTRGEARKVLVEEMTGTLVTIAKDVKIQIEFNPAKVAGYRLIGYENRVLAAEDFNDDKKDAGEIGAGHTVTALYELVPVGKKVDAVGVDELKYAAPKSKDVGEDLEYENEQEQDEDDASDELLTLKIRYKAPDGDKSTKLEFPIADSDGKFAKASEDFKFASAVASFGMLLRDSQHKGNATYAGVAEIAEAASKERDPRGYRREFVEMVKRAGALSGE